MSISVPTFYGGMLYKSTPDAVTRYFSFKILFSFSFCKFFCQSFFILYYISIDLNSYFSKFLYQSFLFCTGMVFCDCAEELQAYFEQYGKVVEVVLKTDQHTGLPRGFGFVGFADSASVDKVTVCVISSILCRTCFLFR